MKHSNFEPKFLGQLEYARAVDNLNPGAVFLGLGSNPAEDSLCGSAGCEMRYEPTFQSIVLQTLFATDDYRMQFQGSQPVLPVK